MSKKKAAQAESTTYIYCGPTIVGLVKQYSLFTGGIPEQLAEAAAKNAAIKALILPVDKLQEARKQINARSGAVYALYKRVQEQIKGGNI